MAWRRLWRRALSREISLKKSFPFLLSETSPNHYFCPFLKSSFCQDNPGAVELALHPYLASSEPDDLALEFRLYFTLATGWRHQLKYFPDNTWPRDIRAPLERAYLGRQRPNSSEIETKTWWHFPEPWIKSDLEPDLPLQPRISPFLASAGLHLVSVYLRLERFHTKTPIPFPVTYEPSKLDHLLPGSNHLFLFPLLCFSVSFLGNTSPSPHLALSPSSTRKKKFSFTCLHISGHAHAHTEWNNCLVTAL